MLTQIAGKPVPFEGIYQHVYMKDIPMSEFVPLAPGESIEREFDIASTADLTSGGAFTISSQGLIPYAEENSTDLTGAMAFEANDLKMEVDGAVAATVEKAIKSLDRRTRLTNSCTGAQRTATERAIQLSAQLSQRSAQVAQNNPAKVLEYFKSDSAQTRQGVARRFAAVGAESTVGGGRTTYDCTDRMGRCRPNTIAYTLPSMNHMTNCPIFYRMPALTNVCHGQDQATTVLHEITHNPAIISPHCTDHAYGYQNIRRLSAAQAFQNADTFSLFANGMYLAGLALLHSLHIVGHNLIFKCSCARRLLEETSVENELRKFGLRPSKVRVMVLRSLQLPPFIGSCTYILCIHMMNEFVPQYFQDSLGIVNKGYVPNFLTNSPRLFKVNHRGRLLRILLKVCLKMCTVFTK